MPVTRCRCPVGRTGYRWGESGTCYCRATAAEARRLAERQGAAARAAGYRGSDSIGPIAPTAPVDVRMLQPAVTHEREYAAILKRHARAQNRRLLRAINRTLRAYDQPGIGRDASWRDAIIQTVRRWYSAETQQEPPLDELRAVGERIAKRAERAARRIVEDAAADLTGETIRVVPLVSNTAQQSLVAEWIAEGTSYIVALPDQVARRVAKYVAEAQDEALRVEDLARTLVRSEGIEARHAELLARDQTGKLNGRVQRAGMKRAGIRRATWQTSGDERVRDRHADLDGQAFDFDAPPISGTKGERLPPGEPIQCRCVAIPRTDDMDPELVALLSAEPLTAAQTAALRDVPQGVADIRTRRALARQAAAEARDAGSSRTR